ncbi:uncharacterized protein [Littorina saxatilis]|uniref:uncharacterized protein n=1 Tax=Littorina saxatilis TaxID=31220 RepID=UPI0038B61B51
MADDGAMADPAIKAQWLSPPKLPRYAGDPADGPVEDFMEEARRILAAYDIPDPIAVEWLLKHLDGLARKEVLAQPADARKTPEQVFDILEKIFGDRRPLTQLTLTFHGRTQRTGESILAYSHALHGLQALIKAKGADEISPSMARDRFITGLNGDTLRRELRTMVRQAPDTTLAAVREEAIRWTREEEPEEAVVRQQATTESADVKALKETVAALTSAMQTMIGKVEDMASKAKIEGQGRRAFVCYSCGQPNHIARNCPNQQQRGHQRGQNQQRGGNA